MQDTPGKDAIISGRRAFSALRWTLAGTIAHRLVSFAGIALIARLVSRDSYGVFRELLSLHMVCFVLLPLGFEQLFVRETSRRGECRNALAGALIMTTLVIGALVLIFREQVSGLLNLGDYSSLLLVFPLTLAMQAAKVAMRVPLAAELHLRAISAGELINTAIASIGGVLAVLAWPSATALYLAFAIGEACEALFLAMRSKGGFFRLQNPLGAFCALFRQHGRVCLMLSADQLLNALGSAAPVLVLGALLSHEEAGSYAMANSLVSMPLYLLVGALGRVVFPSLAGLDEKTLHRRTLMTVTGSAAFVAPVIITLGMLAPAMVTVLLGRKWQDTTPLMVQLIATFSVLAGLFSPISSLDVLRNRPGPGLVWNVAHTAARLFALWFGSRYGVLEAASAYAAVSAIFWLAYGHIQAWLLHAGYAAFYASWLKFVPLWLGLAIGLFATSKLAQGNAWLSLALGSMPIALYFAVTLYLFPGVRELFRKSFPESVRQRLPDSISSRLQH